MSVLLLRLSGPMQSWSTQSRFTVRDTGREPSKSGVIGLLCAALGRRRHEPVTDLASLSMAVRVDHEGRMARDYHTALEVIKADGSKPDTVVSQRYYLNDAEFLVALEGSDGALLQRLHMALGNPFWPLYLGRKSFVPGEPVWLSDGVRNDDSLIDALQNYPWRPGPKEAEPPERLRLIVETDSVDGEPRYDVPLSFAERRFALRYVETCWLPKERVIVAAEDSVCS